MSWGRSDSDVRGLRGWKVAISCTSWVDKEDLAMIQCSSGRLSSRQHITAARSPHSHKFLVSFYTRREKFLSLGSFFARVFVCKSKNLGDAHQKKAENSEGKTTRIVVWMRLDDKKWNPTRMEKEKLIGAFFLSFFSPALAPAEKMK